MEVLYEVEPGGCIVLAVYVQPGASRSAVVGRHAGELKVSVSAPPEGGKANAAVVRLLASALDLRRGDVELVSGERGRSKRVRLRGISEPAVRCWLTAQD